MLESALLIVDDRLARRFALQKGVRIVGTVRLVDLAERRGHMESAERCFNEMTDYGYRVSFISCGRSAPNNGHFFHAFDG